MSYNPFVSLQWMLDGKTVGGTRRATRRMPTREEALRFYTHGSAWFSFDEEKRGSLAAGKLADLAVLTRTISPCRPSEIGGIESLLTMVGGRDRLRRRAIRGVGGEAALRRQGELGAAASVGRRLESGHRHGATLIADHGRPEGESQRACRRANSPLSCKSSARD